MNQTAPIHQIPVTLTLTYEEFLEIDMALSAERYHFRGTPEGEKIDALRKKISDQYGEQFWNRGKKG